MKKAVIFDMDGVLVESESLHYESEKTVLSRLGLKFTTEMHRRYIGYASEHDFWRDIQKEFGVSLNIRTLMLEKMDFFYKHLSRITPIQPAISLLEQLKKAGIPIGLASSTGNELIHTILGQFGLIEYFKAILSGEDVENGKPAPDIYLAASQRIGTSPENCIVIEDSPPGIQAAHAAGMTVVAVPNEFTKMLDFSLADHVLSSLDDFNSLGLIHL